MDQDRIEIRDGKEYRVTVLPDAGKQAMQKCDTCGGSGLRYPDKVYSGRYKNGHRWYLCGTCLKKRSQRKKRGRKMTR